VCDLGGCCAMSNTKKVNRRPGRAISPDEVQRLMAACGRGAAGLRNRAFLALGYGAALRCSEALSIYPRHIDRQPNGGAFVTVASGKGNKSRTVAIGPEYLAQIDRWLDQRKTLGITAASPIVCGITRSTKTNVLGGSRCTFGKPVSPVLMRTTLGRLGEKAGIDGAVRPHGLRHGAATEMAKKKKDLRQICAQLGHSSTATTDRYLAKVAPTDLLEAVADI
jgi:site-specific recombinase XerD